MSKLLKVQKGGNFYIQEFLSPYWMQEANSSEHAIKALKLNNPAAVEGTQLLRDTVAESIKINDHHRGGVYEESGLRTPRILNKQRFATFSGHMFFLDFDLKFRSSDTADVTDMIIRDPRKFYMISAIESPEATRSSKGRLGKDWLHIRFAYRPHNTPIRVFNP